MNKKNTVLLIVLVVLGLIYFGNKFFGGNKEKNFREYLAQIDSSQVDKILVYSKNNDHEVVTLNKVNNNWNVSFNNITDQADTNIVNTILSSTKTIKPIRLVANNKENWNQYEVSDSLGTKVQLFSGDKSLTSFVLGKFSFNQTARTAANFIRMSDELQTYTVEGFMSSTFNKSFDDFRDKTFTKLDAENLTSVEFQYPGDSSFLLNKVDDKWYINDLEANTTSTNKYLGNFEEFNLTNFNNDFNPINNPTFVVVFKGDNMETIQIDGFIDDKNELLLRSSQNKDAFFEQGNLDINEKLFVSSKNFLSNNSQ